jgi:hypothetical protein
MSRYSVLVFACMLAVFISYPQAFAQQTNWISSYHVYDLTDKIAVPSGQPLVSGHTYNVTVVISVPYTVSSNTFQVSLDPSMELSGAQYWYVLSSGYPGYNPSNFVAGSRVQSFSQVQGTLTLSTVFSVPASLTQRAVEGVVLHFERRNVELVSVKIVGGDVVGSLTVNVSDQSIQSYLNEKAQRSSLVSQGKISSSYSGLVDAILARAQSLFQLGLVDQALDLIKVVDPNNFPAPPSGTMMIVFQASTVALAALVAVLLVMYLRRGGRVAELEGKVDAARSVLSGLQVKAARYDKSLAEEIESLKKRLGELK